MNIPENGLIDFYANWCAPCKMMDPTINSLKDEGNNIVKVDTEKDEEMVQYFDISAIPTYVAIKDGKEVGRITGAVPVEKLKKLLEKTKGA